MAAPTLPLNLACKVTINSKPGRKDRILQAQFGNGYGQYVEDGVNSSAWTWDVEIGPLKGQDLVDMRNFITTVGVVRWFSWTPPGEGVAMKWRIDANSIVPVPLNTEQWVYRFKVTQQFDLGS
jgi:phage-related protein